jgi:RHS repeat-associated protein
MRTRFFLALALSFLLALSNGGSVAQAAASYPDDNPEGDTGALKTQVTTGGSYDAQSGNGTRIVNDLTVPDALGVYGLDFTRYWNSLHPEDTNPDGSWSQDFADSGWSHSWRWAAVYGEVKPDTGEEPPPNIWITSITITFPDGHATKFKIGRGNFDHHCGPPYYAANGEDDWPRLGPTIHDKLVEMAEDGSGFWLSRADGGSVHFVGVFFEIVDGHRWYAYQASEVIDPHGLKTELHYDGDYLHEVKQEGGRSLLINWGAVGGLAGRVIESVDSKGKNGEQLQHVSYWYAKCLPVNRGQYVLSKVDYENEPAPGQTSSALYTYSMNYGDSENIAGQFNSFPLLKTANDPHYAGAMTKIGYKYYGDVCPVGTPPPNPTPNPYSGWFHWKRDCITEERNPETVPATVVARFGADCNSASRKDYNGLGGWRRLAFGSLQEHPEMGDIVGYQLTKITDFYPADVYPQTWICRKQNGTEPSKAWDARGIPTEMTYLDASGRPSRIYHPSDGGTRLYDRLDPGVSGSAASPAPECSHNLQRRLLYKKTDELGNYTLYRRDARRRITNISYHDVSNTLMASEAYTYIDATNQVRTHTLPSGATVTYEYDSSDHLFRESNSEDGSSIYTEYHYDALGRVAWVQDPLARSRGTFTAQMTYNGRHQVTKLIYPSTGDATDPVVTYEYDSYGNCKRIVDELEHRKDYTYDSYRRCTSYTEQVNACGVASRTWNWFYDRVLDNGAKYAASRHTSKTWRLQYEPALNDNGDRRMTSRTFDLNDRITSEQTGFDSDTETHKFAYDANGQKSKDTDPFLRETTYTYDLRNRLETTTEPARAGQIPNPVTRLQYDKAGNKTMVTFPDTKTQQWDDYDPFGQAWKFTDERHNISDLAYCAGPMKKLKQVTTHRDVGVADLPTTFNYDTLGRLHQTLFPDGSDEVSTYQFGVLSAWKTRRNQTKHLIYDARGRENSNSWDYGAAPRIDRVWDAANRLTSIANAFSTIGYTYDDASQMLTENSNVLGSNTSRLLQYCRYPNGEVSQVIYPDGSAVVRKHTGRGRLKSVDWLGGSTSYVYLADGKVDYQSRSNGVATSYTYDGRGIVSSVSDKNMHGDNLAHRDYWRDDRDRILAWKRGSGGPNGMENGRGNRYQYDDEGQLEIADYRALINPVTGDVTDPKRRDHFYYDALGNRVGSNDVASMGTINFTRRNNGLNQYLDWTWSAIYHDDNLPPQPSPSPWPWIPKGNGVTMADGYITASFNALNQPVAIWSPAYNPNFLWFGYDPLGRCVKRWKGTDTGVPVADSNLPKYYYYDGWNLVQEGPGGSVVDHTYVHGGRIDEIVASQVDGLWYFHHYDGQGNCMMLTSGGQAGTIQEQYDYDAFGFPYFYTPSGAKFTAPPRTRFLFTGREWLRELRIYDYRARQYQPELGRFLQPDPKQFEAGDYNLYRYCHNDPVNKTDPTGLDAPKIDDPKTQALFDKLKEKSEKFRKEFEKWERDKEKRFIKSANDPGNFKGRNQGPTKNGPGNSTEPESLLQKLASKMRGGQGRGGTIYFNPDNRATAQGRDREPIFGLGNELGHMIDIGNGNWPTSVIPTPEETRRGENISIDWENEARSALGNTDFRPHQ